MMEGAAARCDRNVFEEVSWGPGVDIVRTRTRYDCVASASIKVRLSLTSMRSRAEVMGEATCSPYSKINSSGFVGCHYSSLMHAKSPPKTFHSLANHES